MNTREIFLTKGFSLIELMIAMVIAAIMSLAVLSIFVNQTTHLVHETQRDSAVQEANRTFDLISRLLRQAQKDSIDISYPGSTKVNDENIPEITNDAISIDFTLPTGFNIWPNDQAPYENNNVRLKWDNKNNSENPYVIQIANASNAGGISNFDLKDLAGDNSGDQARIINLDIWPLADQRNLQNSVSQAANNGYLLRVTARTAQKDSSYVNPNVSADSPQKHFRTYTVSGVISPRN